MIKHRIFIPSRNRAAQLRLLIESTQLNMVDNNLYEFYILWQATNESFRAGYEKLQKESLLDNNIKWVEQKDFGDDWLYFLNNEASDIFGFLVDDCIIYEPMILDAVGFFMERSELAESVWCTSYRLGLNTTVQFYGNNMMQPPLRSYLDCGDYIAWRWRDYSPGANYGYPGSLDGCFYRRDDIKKLMPPDWKPSNPRDLESVLVSNNALRSIPRDLIGAPKTSTVICSANNCVQDTKIPFGLKHHYDEKLLNDKYLNNEVIDFNKLDFSNIQGSHTELEFHFKKL